MASGNINKEIKWKQVSVRTDNGGGFILSASDDMNKIINVMLCSDNQYFMKQTEIFESGRTFIGYAITWNGSAVANTDITLDVIYV